MSKTRPAESTTGLLICSYPCDLVNETIALLSVSTHPALVACNTLGRGASATVRCRRRFEFVRKLFEPHLANSDVASEDTASLVLFGRDRHFRACEANGEWKTSGLSIQAIDERGRRGDRTDMSQIGAASYDFAMAPLEAAGLRNMRRRLLTGLTGRVLEVGIGTGASLPHYPPGVEIVAVDPDEAKLARAGQRHGDARAHLVTAKGEDLPFEDESFDAAVVALVLCTANQPEEVVRQIRRVLKPGGLLRAMEHVRLHNRPLAAIQHWLTPAWKAMAGGCHLDRDSVGVLESGGFIIDEVRDHMGGLFVEIYARR